MNSNFLFLRINLLITDVAFIVYWLITALNLLPVEWLFQDYTNPLLVAWNWSFAPVDLMASLTGLWTLHLIRHQHPNWKMSAIISLTLTFCAGLMAISFWTLRLDFDPSWWLPNIYLMVWSLFAARKLLKDWLWWRTSPPLLRVTPWPHGAASGLWLTLANCSNQLQ